MHFLSQVGTAKSAAQAVLGIAVGIAQVYESLAVGRIGGGDARLGP